MLNAPNCFFVFFAGIVRASVEAGADVRYWMFLGSVVAFIQTVLLTLEVFGSF